MSSEGPPSEPDPRLTPIQLAILTTIRRLTQERRGRPPPMRQVAATVSRSLSALYYEYSELEDKGYLRRQPRHPLTVEARLPGEPPFGPEAGDPRPYAKTETVAWVPIAGQIAAGPPILAEPRPSEGYLPLPREVVGRAEGLFILQVSGDSMTGVGINSGDWVVVRQLFQPPRNGDIVAAEIEGVEVEGTVKTYVKDGRDVWLMPQNPAYLPIRGNGAKIQGKVVALLRRVDRRPRRRLPGIPQGGRPAPIPEGNPGISKTQRLLAGSVARRASLDPAKPPMAFLYQLLPASLAATNVKLRQTHYRSNTPEFYLQVTEVTHKYTAFEAIQMVTGQVLVEAIQAGVSDLCLFSRQCCEQARGSRRCARVTEADGLLVGSLRSVDIPLLLVNVPELERGHRCPDVELGVDCLLVCGLGPSGVPLLLEHVPELQRRTGGGIALSCADGLLVGGLGPGDVPLLLEHFPELDRRRWRRKTVS